MSELYTEIETFVPCLPEEAAAKETLLAEIRKYGDHVLDRDCPGGHVTCSGFILSPDLRQTLMAYHLIYQSVGWTGGHADGNPDLLGTALREAREETSVREIYPLTRRILSIDVLPVPAHMRRGVPVEAHVHYNVTYGLIAPTEQPVADKPDENRSVCWFPAEEIGQRCTEAHMLPVYEKLTARMREIAAEKCRIPEKAVPALLAWYPAHHRDLPWRHDREPYHIWLSEIMLQQTRVEAVRSYYARFLEALPDIPALAACGEEQLLKLWEGLGYYSRARNLQKAAQIIMERHGGKFPRTYEEILALPGIGTYTAGAIGSICFALPTPAVDGNVQRVLARLQEDFRNVLNPKVKAGQTQQLSAVYAPENAGMLTQAWIELGATVCIPNGSPRCTICPLQEICMAHRNGSVPLLPVREKKQKRRTEQRTIFVLQCEGRIAIRKRPAKGLLASLWELPNTGLHLSEQEAAAQAAEWGAAPRELLRIVQRRHIFTHITWEIEGVFLECSRMPEQFTWALPEELETRYSLPTAFRTVFQP